MMSTDSPHPVDAALRAGAAALGHALGIVFAATARLRRDKPLHPEGTVGRATLTIVPATDRSGVPLLDEPGQHECLVRASHAMGTGPERSDIEGFALRVLPGERHTDPVDLLFASTGSGSLSRFTLALRRPGVHATQTTLLPVRASGHPLLLRLEPVDRTPPAPTETMWWPTAYEVSWAHGRDPWRYCGDLAVDWSDAGDRPERFDPVVNILPGTAQYPVVERLREPSYGLARRARPEAGSLPASPTEKSL